MSGMKSKKNWGELSPAAKVTTVVLGTIQIALLVATLWDIKKQPAEQIRGDKRIWVGVAFINWIGPLAYFTVGRKDGLGHLLSCRESEEIA